MNRSEIAVNKFRAGYNCAQSVLFSFSDKLNMTHDHALKIANGFGGGMGREQEVCGAVSGGIMVLGLLYGRGENDGDENSERTFQKVRELMNRFKERYGTVYCRDLLNGCNLLSDEGQEMFTSENLIEQCYGYVDSVIKILEEVIDE